MQLVRWLSYVALLRWTKKNKEKLLGKVEKRHTKKELLTNLLQRKHGQQERKVANPLAAIGHICRRLGNAAVSKVLVVVADDTVMEMDTATSKISMKIKLRSKMRLPNLTP